MNRWFASRWLVISSLLSVCALGLSIWLKDPTPFSGVAMATIGLGQAKNMIDAKFGNGPRKAADKGSEG